MYIQTQYEDFGWLSRILQKLDTSLKFLLQKNIIILWKWDNIFE